VSSLPGRAAALYESWVAAVLLSAVSNTNTVALVVLLANFVVFASIL
jgi:hypothetical protein